MHVFERKSTHTFQQFEVATTVEAVALFVSASSNLSVIVGATRFCYSRLARCVCKQRNICHMVKDLWCLLCCSAYCANHRAISMGKRWSVAKRTDDNPMNEHCSNRMLYCIVLLLLREANVTVFTIKCIILYDDCVLYSVCIYFSADKSPATNDTMA